MNVNRLKELTSCVAWFYRQDPTRAGITVSFLPNGRWYLSILRYTERMAEGKIVVTKIQHEQFSKAVEGLVFQFVAEANDWRISAALGKQVMDLSFDKFTVDVGREINNEKKIHVRQSIEAMGQVIPLTLLLDDRTETGLSLLDGWHRYHAFRDLGRTSATVAIYPNMGVTDVG